MSRNLKVSNKVTHTNYQKFKFRHVAASHSILSNPFHSSFLHFTTFTHCYITTLFIASLTRLHHIIQQLLLVEFPLVLTFHFPR